MENNEQLDKIHKINIAEFNQDLIDWFNREQRNLPWRIDKNPYKVWVSEVMLQQTKVDTVIPYFNRFISAFPTIDDLAFADEEEVLKLWEGLGYYSRARNLQAAVKEVSENYGGHIPDQYEKLSALRGVGPYTTGAILSIAFNKPYPAVDGNVMRVLSRLLFISENIANQKTRKLFEKIIKKIIPADNPSDFNQGLMELGAMVCTPKKPSCLLCPVQKHCQAFENGVQEELPVKTKKRPPKEVLLLAVLIKDKKGDILIRKRPSDGLLAHLWEFPTLEINDVMESQKHQIKKYIKDLYDIDLSEVGIATTLKHVFTHLIWNISVFEGTTSNPIKENKELKFVSSKEITKYPFPVPYQKMIEQVLHKENGK